ncbi:TPA: fimbrial protein [Salmonella enterica subsp. enterica serovar Ball]|uniref:fimbrial-like protein n=1 Tax=Salmonella enterica TaxID=28901 RepID=UPI001C438A5C|nr:fimbrial-like protein [Salmonella enterica]HCA3431581.1 fimbrial protein [Salmonella enterica subsp. enterica serovar Ball]HCA3485017.1 fimbrial protein [Salmonella enterica subsp. enterica serovar Ball]HCA3559987.1 fimbrial protein [Salmonella enterica subsp. enterica serovar Ball]HCA3579807.1 fimbrial protein [Salmonella enterica subsp. enterica serovar Ball]
MPSLPFFLRQPGLTLLAGLCCLPGLSQAADLDANLNATIVDTTCKLTVGNGGNVYLPTVMRSWFYNADGSDRYTPTDEAGGTPFTIHVDDCPLSSGLKQLTFRFSPQSGFWSNQNQVFKNDATAGAAENVGVVIFSGDYKTNVLNNDGSSAVAYDVTDKSSAEYLTDYQFYVRYQNTGAVSSGIVTSNVLVDVTYK